MACLSVREAARFSGLSRYFELRGLASRAASWLALQMYGCSGPLLGVSAPGLQGSVSW